MSGQGKTKFELAIIEKVKEIRLQKGFSQTDIARFLDFTKGFIGQIETPSHPSKYNFNHLNILAKEMKCSPREFLPNHFVQEHDWED